VNNSARAIAAGLGKGVESPIGIERLRSRCKPRV
jgi:hypothetical protein